MEGYKLHLHYRQKAFIESKAIKQDKKYIEGLYKAFLLQKKTKKQLLEELK